MEESEQPTPENPFERRYPTNRLFSRDATWAERRAILRHVLLASVIGQVAAGTLGITVIAIFGRSNTAIAVMAGTAVVVLVGCILLVRR